VSLYEKNEKKKLLPSDSDVQKEDFDVGLLKSMFPTCFSFHLIHNLNKLDRLSLKSFFIPYEEPYNALR
jgi:hypothetical protein